MKCCHCGSSESELRPYGPNGAPVCFDCAMKPENKRNTEVQFAGRLALAGDVAMLTEAGPAPFDPEGDHE